MRTVILGAVISAAVLLSSSASADVHLTINNGQVTLTAKDATVVQILAEWARVGQTKIVNGERIAGAPLTLELSDVSEEQALDVILRSVSGYLAAPRPGSLANASRYDRILVMPTSTGTRPAAAPPPTFQQPQFNPPPLEDADDDDQDEEPVPFPPNSAMPTPRNPIFNAFPPGQGQGQGQGMPTRGMPVQMPVQMPVPVNAPGVFTTPPPGGSAVPGTMPAGVSVPGMIVPVPAQPGQPGQPGQPDGIPRNPQD